MSYLGPEYKHDLFVSYASGSSHGDESRRLRKWTKALAERLRSELRTGGLQNFEIFIDTSARDEHNLDVHSPLADTLQKALASSATILFVMTPAYLNSSWCEFERTAWFGARPEIIPEIPGRELYVRAMQVDDGQWPKEFLDRGGNAPPGEPFYQPSEDLVTVRPFGWPAPGDSNPEFNSAVMKLVGSVSKRLTGFAAALKRKREAQAAAERLQWEEGQQIFVDAGARDKDCWNSSVNALSEAGFVVFPTVPPLLETDVLDPRADNEHEQELVRTIAKCDGLLVVAGDDPVRLDYKLASIRNRRIRAGAIANRPLPCAVVDHGLRLDNKPRLRMLANIMGLKWIDASAPNWPQGVKSWLQATGEGART